MRLARLLASCVFSGGVLALTLYACTRVATGVVALTLRVWPLNLLQMVQHHRDQLERRVHGVLIVFAIGAWAARFLDRIDLFQPAWSLGGAILTAKLGRGSIRFSAGGVLVIILTRWLGVFGGALIRIMVLGEVSSRTRLNRRRVLSISWVVEF